MGFGSDGAAVLRGVNNGVAKNLADALNHELVSLHCVCHCAALSGKEGAASSKLSILLDTLLKTIASHFSRSPTRTGIL
jgi:hypothetical protein